MNLFAKVKYVPKIKQTGGGLAVNLRKNSVDLSHFTSATCEFYFGKFLTTLSSFSNPFISHAGLAKNIPIKHCIDFTKKKRFFLDESNS